MTLKLRSPALCLFLLFFGKAIVFAQEETKQTDVRNQRTDVTRGTKKHLLPTEETKQTGVRNQRTDVMRGTKKHLRPTEETK